MSIADPSSYADNPDGVAAPGVAIRRPRDGSTFFDAMKTQARVIGALMLRDFRTRFGGTYLSYSVAVLWPLSHFAILLTVYTFVGRTPSYGTDLFTWVMSGTLPFIVFLYSTRLVAMSLTANANLMSFSVVKRVDVMAARALVEMVTAVIITMVVLAVFTMVRGEFAFHDFETSVLAILCAFFAGMSLGVCAAPIVRVLPMFLLVVFATCIICWLTAGIVYLPDSVPDPYHYYFSFNPLIHCSELFRTGLYADYHSRTLDVGYLLTLSSMLALTGLLLDRYLPKMVTWVK